MSSKQRFYISPELVKENSVEFPSETVHQILHVLRLGQGDKVKVFDGSGKEFLVEIKSISKKEIVGIILEKSNPDTELPFELNLFHGLLKNKSEGILLQKASELGVANFYPFISKRSVNKSFPKNHFEKIIQEACEVVGRVSLPKIFDLQSFENMIKQVNPNSINLLAYEDEVSSNSLKDTLSTFETKNLNKISVNFFIGPEGGFDEKEVALAEECGFKIVSLGKRIVRAETAGILFLSSLLYHFDQV